MLTDWTGWLWNVLIVALPRRVTEGEWKDFKSPANASWPIVALVFATSSNQNIGKIFQ